jgi:hypothetical protein
VEKTITNFCFIARMKWRVSAQIDRFSPRIDLNLKTAKSLGHGFTALNRNLSNRAKSKSAYALNVASVGN